MGLTKPTENKSSGVWDTLLNDLIDIIDAHDHTSGKGVSVPSAALDIDADVAWGGYNVTNMGELGFATTTTGTVAKGLRVKSNELYWRTNGGVDVKLTNGNSLNLALVGGITGDYSSTDADCEYDDATKAYEMKQDESPDHFAKVKCADLHLYEEASGITSFVTVKSSGSLAASFDWIYPTALPVSGTEVVTVTSAGQVDTSLSLSLTSVDITDPGVGHGNRVLNLSPFDGGVNAFNAEAEANTYIESVNGTGYMKITIPLSVGDRIRSITARYKSDALGGTVRWDLERSWDGAGATTVANQVGTSTSWAGMEVLALDHTILASNMYFLLFTADTAGQQIGPISITYDRP